MNCDGITMEVEFYSHVNYSVTKIQQHYVPGGHSFYSHVNYSVTKMRL